MFYASGGDVDVDDVNADLCVDHDDAVDHLCHLYYYDVADLLSR
ncbi:MAG: hypothetical protein WD532_08595 [Acidimicrobiia bacterium]